MYANNNPNSSPSSFSKGDNSPNSSPDPWRFQSEAHFSQSCTAAGWPSALQLYLFGGLSSLLVCVWMWFYNLHLKFAGFSWQLWSKVTTRLLLPRDRADRWSFKDTFDKDNPVKPVEQPKVPQSTLLRRAKLLMAVGTLGSLFQQCHTIQLQSDMLLRRNLRRHRNCFGGLDSNRIKPGTLCALRARVREDDELFSAVTHNSTSITSAIFDTGSSFVVTNNKDLLVPGTLVDLPQPVVMDGIAGGFSIKKKGIGKFQFVKPNGDLHTVECEVYFDQEFPCTLVSPQALLAYSLKLDQQLYDGLITEEKYQSIVEDHFRVFHNRMEWHADGEMLVSIPYDSAFLPRLTIFSADKAESSLKALLNTIHHSNRNLTPLQKAWQLWHSRLGHPAFSLVQKLGAAGSLDRQALELAKIPLSERPMCESCRYGKQVPRSDGSTITKKNPDAVGSLKEGHTVPGMKIFSDQAYSSVPGRLFHTAGNEPADRKFCGSTLFVDAASNYIYIVHQVTFNASDTINAKVEFERHAMELGVTVDSYHTDNGVYKSKAFTEVLAQNYQSIRFSGVGAHWQNGVAEGAIRIVVNRARTMMLHAQLLWPETKDQSLWPMAMSHAVHLYNHTPNEQASLAPLEVFSRTASDFQALRNARTWGCPVYVLEPRLTTAGGKIPKWRPRSRRGQYMGASPVHAETVALVRNLSTGYISPQYHVVFDDKFETVYADEDSEPPEWEKLCIFDRYEVAFDEDQTPPSLADEWLTPQELEQRAQRRPPTVMRQGRTLYEDLPTRETKADYEFQPPPPPENVVTPEPRKPPDKPAPQPTRELSTWTRTPPRRPKTASKPNPQPATTASQPQQPVRRNPSRAARSNPIQRLEPTFHGKSYDQPKALNLKSNRPFRYVSAFAAALALSHPLSPPTVELMHHRISHFDPMADAMLDVHPGSLQSPFLLEHPLAPMAMKAKKKTKDPDLPSLQESLMSPQAEEWWKAMDKEIASLEDKGTWTIVDRSSVPQGCEVIPATWVQRIKRHPDGSMNKFKSRLCIRGDIMRNSFQGNAYSPLVGWPTIRAALLLAATHGWHSRQVDFTLAFCQSPQKRPVYMELPQYYRPKGAADRDVVLKLNKSLYGQVDSPLLFYEHLSKGMKALGFETSASDPCLFIHKSEKIMVLNYCDDQIWLSPDNRLIEKYVKKLEQLGYDLTLEKDSDMFGFLGIDFKRKGQTIELSQTGLINKVLEYTGMKGASPQATPAAREPLGADKLGLPFDEKWSYPAVVGMLLYISSNTRPDIQFAVHQAARFTHAPRKSHAQAVKRILRYLVGTADKGIEFVPNLKAGLDCYGDADFAGLWGHEDDQDPVAVKSRTGYTLTLFGCPIIWASKLQTEITLSSTAAEYVAFSMAMRELLPMRALLKEMGSKLGLSILSHSLVRSTVFEDNQGCLSLVNVPKMSTKNKYLALKYHFFRSHIGESKGVLAKYIKTTEQKADIFTKGLPAEQFQHIRKLLIGW